MYCLCINSILSQSCNLYSLYSVSNHCNLFWDKHIKCYNKQGEFYRIMWHDFREDKSHGESYSYDSCVYCFGGKNQCL